MADPRPITLPALTGDQAASWEALVELAPLLGHHWTLVGGQLAFLHEVERGATDVRPTDDVDVVADLRLEPGSLRAVHDAVLSVGFTQDEPSPSGIAHRFRRPSAGGLAVIDVLAPDHLGVRADLSLGVGRTIEAPGTRQAFGRSEPVLVSLSPAGRSALIRRPNLVGALIGKASAATKIASLSAAERAKHVRDLDALARLLGPADRASADLSRSEQKLVRGLSVSDVLSPLARASLALLVP